MPLRRVNVRDFASAAVFNGSAFRLYGFYAVIAFHGAAASVTWVEER